MFIKQEFDMYWRIFTSQFYRHITAENFLVLRFINTQMR